MPELTSEHLPVLLQQNKEVYREVDRAVKAYLKDHHPSGWPIVDGAMRWIEERHHFIQAPIQDDSLGGFISFGSPRVICYLNSWQPRVYQNFVLLHELFHILSATAYAEHELHVVEADLDRSLDERKADYFASLLLMDAADLVAFYESLGPRDLLDAVVLTMIRFAAPYKAVLIRLFELELIEGEALTAMFDAKMNFEAELARLGKDPSLVQRSMVVYFQDVVRIMEAGQERLPEVANANNWSTLQQVTQYFEQRKRVQ